ncbi:GGDEF domain-containing protein [Colwellia echini]|uniref:diguanylate cyclase n=1 Tax=Colwellia echini TaxID=1982103 RepID=A0ABY3MXK4_9GAMM|nr:GGDEF domain-containing protein [Colwellia echini]TYK65931.1 diguanylate cyclase [Colwellia echini]
MTIFQKMILVPVFSLFLYGSFITYSFFEHQQSNKKIQAVRDSYIPVLEILNNNIHLFEQLSDTFKDTVLARESLWLVDALALKKELENNFVELEKFPHIIKIKQLNTIKNDFNHYYLHADTLAKDLLKEHATIHSEQNTIEDVEHYLHLSENHFQKIKYTVQNQFISTINNTTEVMNKLLFWGGIIAVSSVLLLVIVSFLLSLSTKSSFNSIIERTKLLASGDIDFSKRLVRVQQDELGVLIYWFNKLSDKLESDYLKLQTLSITDKLTQLNNRTRTDQFLPSAIENAKKHKQPLIFIIIDIDHFKKVNDTHGHLVGDDVLIMFATILKDSAKSGDYVSRWGGEEFVLVWQNLHFEPAVEKANDIRNMIADSHFPVVGKVTASIGLTVLTEQDDIEDLISRADKNLYQAKEDGRNRVVADS